MKILFFGDSVTESGRNLDDPNDLGKGYVKFAEGKLRLLYPETALTFLNRGVGGNGVRELLERAEQDVVRENADVVVLQVGIRDIMSKFTDHETSAEEFESDYKKLLSLLVGTGAKVLILQPFALSVGDKARLFPRLAAFNKIIRAAAKEYSLPVIPMDEIFKGAAQDIKPTQFTTDGIHPTHRGHRYLADFVVKELKKSVL